MTDPFSLALSSVSELAHAAPDMPIAKDMAFALLLGFLFGYERSYHGRAAGMRTYGIVCMVAAALTSASAHLEIPAGGAGHVLSGFIDPTRTIQGIVTGVGFLGAGIIMKDGLKISGLTTAASIWASSAIGILAGLGFYMAALFMTLLAELFVLMGSRFDVLLPSRRPIYVSIRFKKDFFAKEETVRGIIKAYGYELAKGSVSIQLHEGQTEWRFVAISVNRRRDTAISELAEALPLIEGVDSFHISRARN